MEDFVSTLMEEHRVASMELISDNAANRRGELRSHLPPRTTTSRKAPRPDRWASSSSSSSVDNPQSQSLPPSSPSNDCLLSKPIRRQRSSSLDVTAADLAEIQGRILSLRTDDEGDAQDEDIPQSAASPNQAIGQPKVKEDEIILTSPPKAFRHNGSSMSSISDYHSPTKVTSASLINASSEQLERIKALAALSPADLCKVKQQKFSHRSLAVANALSSSHIHASLNKNPALQRQRRRRSSISFPMMEWNIEPTSTGINQGGRASKPLSPAAIVVDQAVEVMNRPPHASDSLLQDGR